MNFNILYKIIKNYNGAILVGILSYIFYFLSFNSIYFSKLSGYVYYALGFGVFFLYAFIYYIIRKDWIRLGLVGLFFSISFLFTSLYLKINEINKALNEPKELKTKRKSLLLETVNCEKYKYGSFLTINDTLKRFRLNGKDYQKFQGKTTEINWIDKCTYTETNKNSKQLLFTYTLIDFKENNFNILIKSFQKKNNYQETKLLCFPIELLSN